MCLPLFKCALAIAALAGCCSVANAGIITIDAQVNGASTASGGPQNPDVLPGAFLPDIYSPKNQLTLSAGTYLITNGATSGYYSAWNFEGYPSSPNWVWSFLIADDATSKVLVDGFVLGIQSTQAGMASLTGTTTWDGNTQLSATSTQGFTDTMTLTHTTTLDFLIDDYFLGDNGGGVTLDIAPLASSVPVPSTIALLGVAAVIGICYSALRRRGSAARSMFS
jgi:hypothetical protein